MKVLVTGANGLLAPYIVEAFSREHQVSTTTREGCDLTRRASVKALLLGHLPDVVIHCAALTSIDECEKDPIRALEVNRDIPWHIVEQMPPTSKFVYISTDMVYPDIRGPHVERDVGPVNVYGRSKLSGEKAAAVNPRHLILRTNFFGPTLTKKASFSDWVIQSLQNGSTPIFFNDVWWSPLHLETLSDLILEAVERDLKGIYNLGASNYISKAVFAMALAKQKGLLDRFERAVMAPAHWQTRRTKDLSMDCAKIEKVMEIKLPSVEEEIMKL